MDVETAIRALVEALRAEMVDPDRLLTIPEAAAALGIGRSTLYQEMFSGRIRTVKVGRRRLVPHWAIREYIADAS